VMRKRLDEDTQRHFLVSDAQLQDRDAAWQDVCPQAQEEMRVDLLAGKLPIFTMRLKINVLSVGGSDGRMACLAARARPRCLR
jgi:hypothetical protein